MKNEKLFEAIGGLDDTMIAEAETTVKKHTRRIGWKVVLVAAIIAGLAVSAGAAPLIRNALLGGKMETDDTSWFTPTNPVDGSSHEIRQFEITLDVDMDKDAPKEIETFYVPRIPENVPQYLGRIYGNNSAQYGWYSKDSDQGFFFCQQAGGSIRKEDLDYHMYAVPGDQPMAELRTFAGIEGYLVAAKPVGDEDGDRVFFWSDGDYLFRLEVPYEYTDAQLEEVIASVKPEEDIVRYLRDMTDQEIEDYFG